MPGMTQTLGLSDFISDRPGSIQATQKTGQPCGWGPPLPPKVERGFLLSPSASTALVLISVIMAANVC